MIKSKNDLKYYIETEKEIYISSNKFDYLKSCLRYNRKIHIWKYIKVLRKAEYYFENRKKNFLNFLLNVWYSNRKNRLAMKLGMDIDGYVFEEGLTIYHTYGIVVNGDAKVGKNCVLHGANVIGNMGTNLKAPVIGDNVRLGTGAKVLGDIYIADDVQIGAGALVLESCYEKGALLVGVPAKVHERK